MNWKATMPKELPQHDGTFQVVFGYRGFGSLRAEFTGCLKRVDAERVMALIIELSKDAARVRSGALVGDRNSPDQAATMSHAAGSAT
jgi:hypothetical protein